MKITPDLDTFRRKCSEGNLIPVWAEVLADMQTPVSAFRKLDDGEFAFLLESVEQGDRIGRYSFLGCNPSVVIQSRGTKLSVIREGGARDESESANSLLYLREYMKQFRPVVDSRLPPFIGGAVGYLSYDIVRSFERLPDKNPDDLQIPESSLMIVGTLIAFDHVRRRMILIHNAHVEGDPDKAYREAVRKIEALRTRLRGAAKKRPAPTKDGDAKEIKTVSNLTREQYEASVRKGVEYIRAGDVFQVVLSQRFERTYHGDPFDIYRALRAINPSPYMVYLKYGDLVLAGASPEVLVTVRDRQVRLRPIAGTRRRGETPAEDRALEAELLADPKERAEHIMLVDLGRNDTGRVSEPGSVVVDDLMVVEHYSHVMHIVSNVVGRLKQGCDGFDAVMASLPAGTLSGAPKIRAMEIIDELENVRRGPYGGAMGYFGFNGNLDFCITIRTVALKGDHAYVQAGAGIVADSDPATEFEETLSKARATLNAIEMAEGGLD